MYDCKCLIHPFQNDPGTSQQQRVMDDLLDGAAQIDARSLADLLDFFVQMSRHINYYDKNLLISDWQPFFQKSTPFILSSIIKNSSSGNQEKLDLYAQIFQKKPLPSGLQLNAWYIYFQLIRKLNNWYLSLKDSGLPIVNTIEVLIKDKLQHPAKEFIKLQNAAVKEYQIRKIDVSVLAHNPVWNISAGDLSQIEESYKDGVNNKIKKLQNLYTAFTDIAIPFINVLQTLSLEAESNLEASFLPLKSELQKKHPPHLGLLFAFLNIFRQLQDDLNSYTRKHLNFFYQDVLKIQSRAAIADKTHVVFEIQKQVEKYLLKKGLLVRDGKDNNKQEILFGLDDDIAINKTEVAAVKTLFLNQVETFQQTFVEGVYIAEDATKADGVDKDFSDNQPKNFSTVGAKMSKYRDPLSNMLKPNASARLGFMLASPVLLLKEGKRTVTVHLACELQPSVCALQEKDEFDGFKGPCDKADILANAGRKVNKYPPFLSADEVYAAVENRINRKLIYLDENVLQLGLAKGIDDQFIIAIRDKFLRDNDLKETCYGSEATYKKKAAVPEAEWNALLDTLEEAQRKPIAEFFKIEGVFKVSFSGEKGWVETAADFQMSTLTGVNFKMTISTVLQPNEPAVVNFDPIMMQEDFGTRLPVLKIELNDKLKFEFTIEKKLHEDQNEQGKCIQDEDCCLLRDETDATKEVSFYHFFRNVRIVKGDQADETRIDVKVCGLKNFIVQNDESLQDVNAPVYPFGVRPKIESNFYIGSEEALLKNWKDIIININWKDLPPVPPGGEFAGKRFKAYYNGYQDFYIDAGVQDKVVDDDKFRIQIAILQDGEWIHKTPLTSCNNPLNPVWRLFQPANEVGDLGCHKAGDYSHQFAIHKAGNFNPAFPAPEDGVRPKGIKRFAADSRNAFIRITLKCQDFQHDRYAYVLARQMSAFGKLPQIVNGAVYYGVTLPGPPPEFETLDLPGLLQEIIDHYKLSIDTHSPGFNLITNTRDLVNEIIKKVRTSGKVNKKIWEQLFLIDNPSTGASNDPPKFPPPALPPGLNETDSFYFDRLFKIITWLKQVSDKIQKLKDKGVVIPKEPWTPIISNMSLDYTATAKLEEIDLIHLYPLSKTYKAEVMGSQPAIFPVFCDEGSLFLGLKNLVPGENLNLLFQLAEATSDSESEKEQVQWYYLSNNQWKFLRPGFEVLDDATDNLTSTGVIKLALPAGINRNNTIMPADLFWIKASIAKNSRAVSETTGIHTQAISVTFTNADANDKLRLSGPLPAGKISRLNEADANVKSVQQPYESFGGVVPEHQQQYYIRISELLRHKGRAIQKFDYERIVLQAFPKLFRVKCINHSFALNAHQYKYDFPYAPGYVLLAVIPDLNKLKAGDSFEPKVPAGMLEKIESYVGARTSPFVRLKVMNPRYEKVNFCLRVNLLPGKDANYYREKLKEDLRELLAPWSVGKFEKLSFGQCVYRSDVIRFLEQTDYVDYLTNLRFAKDPETPDPNAVKVCPDTPRSILIAGDIEVCINKPACEDWGEGKCENEVIPMVNHCKEKPVIT